MILYIEFKGPSWSEESYMFLMEKVLIDTFFLTSTVIHYERKFYCGYDKLAQARKCSR